MEIQSNRKLAHILVQPFKDQRIISYETRALGVAIRTMPKPCHFKKGLSNARTLFI